MPSQKNSTAAALQPGRIGTASLVVDDSHTAQRFGSGRAPVFATPAMVALMEAAAVACVEDQLDPGQETLGVHFEIDHIAATPVGLKVTASAELIEHDGRKLVFRVEARTDQEAIGRGRHTRVIVESARFRNKVAAKRTS